MVRLMEQMIEVGINEGLSPEIANELVIETALGAARMAKMSIDMRHRIISSPRRARLLSFVFSRSVKAKA